MNKKMKILGTIELIFAIVILILSLLQYDSGETSNFVTMFVIVLSVTAGLSLLTARTKYRLLILYVGTLVSYITSYALLFPGLFAQVEIGIVSFIVMAPLVFFLVVQLFKFEDWGNFRAKVTTRWNMIRFWLVVASLGVMVAGIALMFYPEYQKWGNIILIPGMYFLGPFFMLVLGYVNYEIVARYSELDTVEPKAVYLNVLSWAMFATFLFEMNALVRDILNLVMIVAQITALIWVIVSKDIHMETYEHFMKYNPIRPNKNSFNHALATFVIWILELGALIYIVFVVATAYDLISVVVWNEYVERLDLDLEFQLVKDPLLYLYFFVGFIGHYFQKLLEPEENVFDLG